MKCPPNEKGGRTSFSHAERGKGHKMFLGSLNMGA